ncbi:Helix-turn-helix domain-containing protein [Streptomyces sp. LcepLS]|uniref:helix-turn-helix domain-containing protein n=2 Tax=Streptomyces TaxID=1883 RepID=UPI00081DE1F8|nr:Helix-turn-helix domain-containing protein [Streptomyces sp. TverLS-915]SCF14427.1 Helix-turn-helix domain-containing protein [Streptomyces sp. LcepLS]
MAKVKRLRNGEGAGSGRSGPAVWGRMEVHFRTQAGVTQAELARALNVERSLVSKFESGDRVPDLKHAEDADAFLDAGGALVELWKETDWYPQVEHPDWFKRRADMDLEATAVYEYATLRLPGLLQTPEYALALFGQVEVDAIAEERVRARMSRQLRFQGDDGPTLVALLDESCVRNVVGGSAVMRDQCAHLLNEGRRLHVRIHVVPAASPYLVPPKTAMTLVSLPDGHRWVYSESLEGGHFNDDPAALAKHSQTYDVLRADCLSVSESAALIRDAMEGYDRDDKAERRRSHVDQEQLQRQRRRQLHRNRVRVPRPRPRS